MKIDVMRTEELSALCGPLSPGLDEALGLVWGRTLALPEEEPGIRGSEWELINLAARCLVSISRYRSVTETPKDQGGGAV